ncbi:MAG TPA: ornithine carbamoyltransferase [Chloroflexota bacterium]|nr:ornithine carbamoyltransferase [Chloroflexota bacterium]
MKRGDFLSLKDLSSRQVDDLLDLAHDLKAHRRLSNDLSGKSVALLFQMPSLRTRTSFDVGLYELGGHAVYLGPDEVGLGKRESIPDVARVLSRYVHAIVARIRHHRDLLRMAEVALIPVVNALSDFEHPCQSIADLMTMRECAGKLAGLRVAYLGDGNNVARSLVFASAKVGIDLVLASPDGCECDHETVSDADIEARRRGGAVTMQRDPRRAAKDADVIYTDVWTSMGQEHEAEKRRQLFGDYQVTQEIVELARPGVLVMHDLPAHRGEEIADDVIDGPRSVVFQQAENRLHAQKAILVSLLGDGRDRG